MPISDHSLLKDFLEVEDAYQVILLWHLLRFVIITQWKT